MRYSTGMLAPVALMGGCALQPAYQRPALDMPVSWTSEPARPSAEAGVYAADWWRELNDPAINQLVEAGLRDNPTLAEAAARVDQARAAWGVKGAQKSPAIGLEVGAERSRDRSGNATSSQNSADVGATLSWEVDLWGRIRASSDAARYRLAARTADARGARLLVAANIADSAVALRACTLALEIRNQDILSRGTELDISRARLSLGSIAPVMVAAAESRLASARTDLALQEEACSRIVAGLVALSGLEPARVREILRPGNPDPNPGPNPGPLDMAASLPAPPPYVPALPATVLLGHPAIVAAEREVAARWSEIEVARAERLPRLDLAAALSGQWIHALGSGASFVSGSIGAGLSGPLLDGGAGAARVQGAEAEHREALAQLHGAIRVAVRDVEYGLAARQSADRRMETTRAALEAAQFALRANEARWRAGAIAQYELEESRRQYNQAQESVVVAAADRARAWIMLVRQTADVASVEVWGETHAGRSGRR